MKTWIWILGWSLSILTITGNGFIVFLVCSKRQLHTKTNAFVVSLAVADFCVGVTAVPSLFFCKISTACDPQAYLADGADFPRWLFQYASVMNLCSLVLDRYMAVVKPLTYLTFMRRRRVIQMISLSWIMSAAFVLLFTLNWLVLKISLLSDFVFWVLMIFFELVPCCVLMFCFACMLHVVCRHDRAARTLAKQIRFNHHVLFKNHEKSAVIMMAIVIGLFLVCYSSLLRCSIIYIFHGSKPCNDQEYKIPLLVLNSAINPAAYAFYKRDIRNEIKRRVCNITRKQRNQIEPVN